MVPQEFSYFGRNRLLSLSYASLIVSLLALGVRGQDATAPESSNDEVRRKYVVIREVSDPSATMMSMMVNQITPSLAGSPLSENVKVETLKLYPLMWQSYLWLTYRLQEECIICGVGENKDGNPVAVLMLAERLPYEPGKHEWSVEWRPSIGVGGELTFNWTVCSLPSLKEPLMLFRWCENRSIFERVKEVGAPLIQRWLFEANWKQSVGSERTKSELQLFMHPIPFGTEEKPAKPGTPVDEPKR